MRENYSEEEWKCVASMPQTIGAAVANAGYSGLIGTAKEAAANVRTMIEGTNMFPENDLIAAIAPNREDLSAAKDRAAAHKAYFKQKIEEAEVSNHEELNAMCLGQLEEALCLVDEKENEEAAMQYRHWIYAIAEKVAKAAKEGDFLGFGGKRVSDGEQVFLDSLKETLGIGGPPA